MNKAMFIISSLIFVLSINIIYVSASIGDRSQSYQTCLKECVTANCTQSGLKFVAHTEYDQDGWSKLLGWKCKDECKYNCMWDTVQLFENAGAPLPKFHGKWPFIRICGLQEPASVFSSILNLVANAYMYSKLRMEFPMKTRPIVTMWHLFAFVCMNAWMWSTVFHMRDTPFTEFMDYSCALSMVLGLFVTAVVRVFGYWRRMSTVLILSSLLYFCLHVQYLYTGIVDYSYNMIVNVVFGACGTVVWTGWGVRELLAGRGHALRLCHFTLGSTLLLALELLDFPPAYRMWDAHALWHLTTAPLPILFFQYVIDDLRHIEGIPKEKDLTKLT